MTSPAGEEKAVLASGDRRRKICTIGVRGDGRQRCHCCGKSHALRLCNMSWTATLSPSNKHNTESQSSSLSLSLAYQTLPK
ncbi:hypothetical protein PIB30_018946, partial [Stylosanthes scabra]|nr:hypothetical protein [Stylosanthes scabra]